jgi:lambda repressor-like predicted transcriptional regulator
MIPIDLTQYPEQRIWQSLHLDHVAKVALSILRLSQQNSLDISTLRHLLRNEWPDCTPHRQRRYIVAAISYLRLKNPITAQTISELGADMRFAHPINPDSSFAQELREEFAKGKACGVEEGREEGMEQGFERGLALGKLELVQSLLAKGCDWDFIQSVTQLNQADFEALQTKFAKS